MFTRKREKLIIRREGNFSELEACVEIGTTDATGFVKETKSRYEKDRSEIGEMNEIFYNVSQKRIELHTQKGHLDAKIKQSLVRGTRYLKAKIEGENDFVSGFFDYLQRVCENAYEEDENTTGLPADDPSSFAP